MKELHQSTPESASTAPAAHAHPWLDAFTESFVIEIEQTASNDADTQQTGEPNHCTLQLNAWWTRLI